MPFVLFLNSSITRSPWVVEKTSPVKPAPDPFSFSSLNRFILLSGKFVSSCVGMLQNVNNFDCPMQKASVIKQKGESQNVSVRIKGVRNALFSKNLACFIFLKLPIWDSPFCLTTDEDLLINFLPRFVTQYLIFLQLKLFSYNWFYVR